MAGDGIIRYPALFSIKVNPASAGEKLMRDKERQKEGP